MTHLSSPRQPQCAKHAAGVIEKSCGEVEVQGGRERSGVSGVRKSKDEVDY